ncbi:toll/interleukin-1 receptor domain-containing protein [Streptomyces sp. NPDC057638]|uniref:toll/interleukin-1 receptor domain-containing protein n=1 Tax=Streptomyces sp. NPDC057638 TaxID=3346190 RepID=UPI0036CB755A
MPDVFINYRTGDGEAAAALVERELTRRFGEGRVFRASKSIRAGSRYPAELVTAVRRSSVLLAIIGPDWAEAKLADGRRALEVPSDWTRREIVEAFDSGALVIPVLVGRTTRLNRRSLPPRIAELADRQYRRLDLRNADADLARLGDDLANLVPQLADADRDRATDDEQPTGVEAPSVTRMAARDVRIRQRSGIGNLNGDLSGTFVSEPQAPVHTGQGDQYNAPRFSGDNTGVNYTAGDSSGMVEQRFERGGRRADDER